MWFLIRKAIDADAGIARFFTPNLSCDKLRDMQKPLIRPTPFLVLLVSCICSLRAADAVITINSTNDVAVPPPGTVTLRSALAQAAPNEPILFAPALDGTTIGLTEVGAEHTPLVGEVMGITNAPSGPISYLIGYFERDYGRSALYAKKNVTIDASALTNGVTIAWTGGATNAARVLAIHGDLTLNNVGITGGYSQADDTPLFMGGYTQATTRARGGGLAVWGTAQLENCRVYGNTCASALLDPARDAGIFGGGVYADIALISDSIICGNTLSGTGVSGGGVFSVGGAGSADELSRIERSVISGNRIEGIFAYGAGVYSDGGGIGNLKTLELENCTIAENRVGISGPGFLYGSGYWRGGGVYMSNGRLSLRNCTVVENEVEGVARTNELDKPNLAGGVAATIGNAHAAESITIGRSIIAGNTVHEFGGASYAQDLFTGSLFTFLSEGHNRIGTLNFDQMLVPVGKRTWYSLCRRHYPKTGDIDGVNISNILDLAEGTVRMPGIPNAGVNSSNSAVRFYIPKGSAVDQVPAAPLQLDQTLAEYQAGSTDNFLEILLGRLEAHYSITNFASTFTADFETFLALVDTDPDTPGNQPYTDPDGTPILTLDDTLWFGPKAAWPSKLYNYPYIEFWHRLDAALAAENLPGMGPAGLDDAAWQALFTPGALPENPNITFYIWTESYSPTPTLKDQEGTTRPRNGLGDIGAIEWPSPYAPPPSFDSIAGAGTHVILRWTGSPGRTYTLWSAPAMNPALWSMAETGITGTVPLTVHSVATDRPAEFFRVETEPLD